MTTDVGKPPVHPLVQEGAERAWHFKEIGCKARAHHDIVPMVQFFKDGELIVEMLPGSVSRDNALAIADIVAGPVDPDIIVANLDAHVTQSMTNPVTGERWKPGEMQGMCNDDGACATGLLADCITTMAIFRDGSYQMLSRRYTGHEGVDTLVWQESDHIVSNGKDASLAGYVMERLAQAMIKANQPGMFDRARGALNQMAQEDGMSEAETYWHGVVAGCHLAMLSGAAAAVMAFPPPDCEHVIAEHLTEEKVKALAESEFGMFASLLRPKYGIE